MAFLEKQIKVLLESTGKPSDEYLVEDIPKFKKHKLGLSNLNLPIFFLKCSDNNSKFRLDIDLDIISVVFDKECELTIANNSRIKGTYTIVELKADLIGVTEYFLDIFYLMLQNLPTNFTMEDLEAQISKIVDLFSRLSEPPRKLMQGLWAELLIIERAKNPDYLVKSWHFFSNDKFDFNDSIDKLEVKSTSGLKRKHTFSLEQLNPNISSQLIIASVLAISTGEGKSVMDLCNDIEKKLKVQSNRFVLKKVILETLGSDFEKADNVFFDYEYAKDNLAFYLYSSIPRIDPGTLPREISNVRFECDLSNVPYLKSKSLEGKLFQSLI